MRGGLHRSSFFTVPPLFGRPENVRGKRGMRGKWVWEHSAPQKDEVGGSAEMVGRAQKGAPYAP